MGVGIPVMVVGAVIGVLIMAAPQGIVWVRRRWRSGVHEPSVSVYWLARGVGMAVVLGALVFGCLIVVDARGRAVQERVQRELAEAEATFTPPAPQKRGPLPVVGYLSAEAPGGESLLDVYYIAPPDSGTTQLHELAAASKGSDGRYPCYSDPVQTSGQGRVVFNAELIWAPEQLSDMAGEAGCSVLSKHQIREFTVGQVPAWFDVVTDAPIVDVNGTIVVPAAPGNTVPQLTERPDTSATRTTGLDRGEIPLVGYRDDGHLAITYLTPDVVKAHAGRMDGTLSGGCEIVPTFTGLGSGEVTIGLRLVWSNPDGHARAEDDANCQVGTKWSGVMTSRLDQIPSGTSILTDGPIANPNGAEVVPAAPGNVVPATG